MKKILGLLAIVVSILIAFGTISKRAEANKAVFSTGSQDERDIAKRISLDILRERATTRLIGNVDDFEIQKIEIDDLQMAHTRVRQTVNGIPVWEGEAIDHLRSDGTLVRITDGFRDGITVNLATSVFPVFSCDIHSRGRRPIISFTIFQLKPSVRTPCGRRFTHLGTRARGKGQVLFPRRRMAAT